LVLILQVTRPDSLQPDHQLYLFLYWFRHYHAERDIAQQANIHQTTLFRQNMCILYLLDMLWKQEALVSLPSAQLRIQLHNLQFRNFKIAVIVDGKHQEVEKPMSKELRLLHWSGKAQAYTRLLLIFIAPSGLIYFVTQSYPGSCVDKTIWDFVEVQDWLHFLEDDEAIMGDKGFAGIQRDHLSVLPVKGAHTPTEIKGNAALSSIRVKVENVLAELTQWKICNQIFRHDHGIHSVVWQVAAGFVNLKRWGWRF